MKRLLGETGYTIIEVMMVLAISGGLLASVAVMISNQQERTEFAISTRSVESTFQDLFNDVESGVINNNGKLSCSAGDSLSATVGIDPTAAEQGTNTNCVYLGKAIHFYRTSATAPVNNYTIVNIVGKRQYKETALGDPINITTIDKAKPTAFYRDDSDQSPVTGGTLENGLQVTAIYYFDSSTNTLSSVSSRTIGIMGQMGVGGETGGYGGGAGTNIAAGDGGSRIVRIVHDTIDSVPLPPKMDTALQSKINSLGPNDLSGTRGALICLNTGPNSRTSAVAIGIKPKTTGAGVEASGQRNKADAYYDKQAEDMGCPHA